MQTLIQNQYGSLDTVCIAITGNLEGTFSQNASFIIKNLNVIDSGVQILRYRPFASVVSNFT